MAGFQTFEININLPEDDFIQFCVETITEKKQTIEKSLCDGIEYVIRESLKNHDFFIDAHYYHNFELYDKCFSLKEYIDKGHISIHYFEIIVECKIVKPSMEIILFFPYYISPGDMGLNYPHDFEADYRLSVYDKKALRTKPKYIFKKIEIRIASDTLQKIYNALPDIDILMPSNFSPAGDWRRTFYNIKTGESYFCSCFQKAINIERATWKTNISHPHIKYAIENKSYLERICHLCTNTVPRQGSFNKTFGGTYGAYIYKTAFERYNPMLDNFDLKEAENIVRKMVDFPLIGEGWPSETLLYKRIKKEFPEIEVIHHGRPVFLGRQEYDIWIPQYKIAIEYQGIQHYESVEHWGGEKGLERRKDLDKQKLEISKENGVTLIYADVDYNFTEIVDKIRKIISI